MTKQELNRDIKRMFKQLTGIEGILSDEQRKGFTGEFKRLYLADPEFDYINKDNILRLIHLNNRFNFYPHYWFGNRIKAESL